MSFGRKRIWVNNNFHARCEIRQCNRQKHHHRQYNTAMFENPTRILFHHLMSLTAWFIGLVRLLTNRLIGFALLSQCFKISNIFLKLGEDHLF
ncbi:hypothetical protein D3C79_827200 [compost metagenome]